MGREVADVKQNAVFTTHGLDVSTLVVGLGMTGLSCVRFLVAQGVPVAVIDSRMHPPALDELRDELPDVACFLGGFDPKVFKAANQLVVSPGVSLKEPLIAEAINNGTPVIGDIELFARFVDTPVVAITGSNGKSTVTTLLGEMAKHAGFDTRVGGNLGTPALELLTTVVAETESGVGQHFNDVVQHNAPNTKLYVLELSSFQLETTFSLNPKAAVILNISPDHMDRYQTLDDYIAAKQRIFDGDGTRVINLDDPLVATMAGPSGNVVGFTLNEPAEGVYGLRTKDGQVWLAKGEQLFLPASEVRIKGQHNLANALAALALGEAIGISVPAMLQTLREFPGLPHRMQWVAEHDGVTWYNDSKATNVGATLAALSGLPDKVVLIAGGDGKGADFTPLREAVAQKARAVVLIGRDALLMEKALAGVTEIVHAQDMDQAVVQAGQRACPGDSVLLAPACASFDMYSGYQQRGEVFIAAVHKWVQ